MKYGDVEHNTEDKIWWLRYGEEREREFIERVCPEIGIQGTVNPKKSYDPTAPDLIVNGHLADLKCQDIPFFTAGRYRKDDGTQFEPRFTVTFNQKDYERYKAFYPDIDIYFWVNWSQLEYESRAGAKVSIEPLAGVWYSSFQKMADNIAIGKYPLHQYLRRKYDVKGNAKASFLVDLRDLTSLAVLNGL